jgi:hypothetical protein
VKAVGRALLDGEAWRVPAHLRAWLSAVIYLPAAVWERVQRKARGVGRCRFWHMVRRDALYFRGVEFPERGWYAERDVAGMRLRPIAARAAADCTGPVEVTHGNAYPDLGETHVNVLCEGQAPLALRTRSIDSVRLQETGSSLEFVSERIFDADDTGELADFGGWLRVEAE